MNSKPLLDPVPIRFSPSAKARLKSISTRFGLNPSELIRRAVEKQLPEWESSNELVLKGKDQR